MKNIFKSKKGSPTLEYVLIIAAGAAFAALLLGVFSKEDGGVGEKIQGELQKRVIETIEGATQDGSGNNGD